MGTVAPALERRTYLGPSASGSGLAPAVTVLGVEPAAEAALHDWPLVAGAALGDTDRPVALITERLAAEDGLALGSTVSVQGVDAPATYTVVGHPRRRRAADRRRLDRAGRSWSRSGRRRPCSTTPG